MNPQLWLEAATLVFNLTGMLICILGLTMAQKMTRRWPGYVIAVIGFLVATMPMFYQLVLSLRGGV
jgi:MFS superfamily sulfate permease-like transporter